MSEYTCVECNKRKYLSEFDKGFIACRDCVGEIEKGSKKVKTKLSKEEKHDPVNHPRHYTEHPSGLEAIEVTSFFGFCLGNTIKYIWRAELKDDALEDLKKARWYLDYEIKRRESESDI